MPDAPLLSDQSSAGDGGVIIWERSDFQTVRGVTGKFYCPGCNRSPDDHWIKSVSCPCATHAKASGSLTAAQVERYLSRADR